jgi:predicted DNA-binding transcriptional regulator AlpA
MKQQQSPAELPRDGFVRINQILGVLPISASTWWRGIRAGIYPSGTKLGPKLTVWSASSIRELLAKIEAGAVK